MKYILTVILLLAFQSRALGQKENVPRQYIAHKISEKLTIDGKGDETSWAQAPESQDFIDIEGEIKPAYRTTMKMLWDEGYLYFYAKMEEPHIWATLKQRDTVIFYNNDFEIFIDPDGDTHNYYEFEMNALNTVWDLFIVKPYREPAPILDSWDIQGLQSEVFIEGTLNDASDEDKYWSVEVAIPWEVLKEANRHNEIPKNEFWRINFSRVNWDFDLEDGTYSRAKNENGEYKREYNWVWSPQGVINMHEPEHWGYVYFSEKPPGEIEEFIIPDDEKIKWELYKLYRAQKIYKEKNGNWASSLSNINGDNLKVEGKKIKLKLEVHQTGWNIWGESPFTGDTLIIREDGKFIKQEN